MASNITAQINHDKSDFVDWIELCNTSGEIVNISGIYVTDDLSNPFKWQLNADVSLQPNAYFIIWADGLDYENHASFKLSGTGEQIGLFYPDGRVMDTLTFGKQRDDISFGRFPDAGNEWHYFTIPTCEGANINEGLVTNEKTSPPVFTPGGGIFTGNLLISMNAEIGTITRYTMDGSIPSIGSPVYNSPISIDKTTVFRARGFRDNFLPSEVVTHSYVIDEPATFPVISIATPPEFLFDEEIGITVGVCVSDEPGEPPPFDWSANYWQRWERPIHMEYFTPEGIQGFSQDAGIAIFGGFLGRQLRQKAFTLYARNKYGDSDFDFPLFPSKPINSYRRFILRASSNDFNRTFLRDAMMQTLVIGQMDLDYQAYQPVIVYINGDFWGLYNMREKTNQFYPEHNYGIDSDSVDLVEGIGNTAHGDGSSYRDLLDYVSVNDMTNPEHYEYIRTQMDITEFMNYYITEMYVGNRDWLHQNIKCWREHNDDGQWRWLLYDLDWGFSGEIAGRNEDYRDNMLQWILEQGEASLLFQKLIENEGFRFEFVQRFATHLNLTFNPDRVHHTIRTMADRIAPEIPRQIERWGALQSMEYWNGELDVLNQFALERPFHMTEHLDAGFMMDGKSNLVLEVSSEEAGWITIFDAPCPSPLYSGIWYDGIDLEIEAHANPGWKFAGWIGDHESQIETIEISLMGDAVLHAVFEPYDLPSIVISEIHYNPSSELQGTDEDFEFLELFNNEKERVDISDYQFTDGIEFTFPRGSIMDPGETIILALNPEMYTNSGSPVYPVLSGRLNNAGEILRLCDHQDMIIDQVHYDDHFPWPREPDGEGPSLELKAPWLDNSLASSWKTSDQPGGTPGSGIQLGVWEQDLYSGKNLLNSIYPNPFRLKTHINYSLYEEAHVTIRIFNPVGREVDRLVNEKQPPGMYEIGWIPENLPGGIYFLQIVLGRDVLNGKVLYIKQH